MKNIYFIFSLLFYVLKTISFAQTNPCTSPPSGSCIPDLTPDKSWGTDADCDGTNDISVDWCPSVATNLTCSSSSADILSSVGNSNSFWGSFTYNSADIKNYGDFLGFWMQASGNAGKPIFGQVYDLGGCPIGSPAQINSWYDFDISSIGLNDGANYLLRVWATSGNAGSPAGLTSIKLYCTLKNTYNDKFDNAAPIVTHSTSSSRLVHVTMNGNTIADATSGTSDCYLTNPNGSGIAQLTCSAQTVVTNDSWFRVCSGNTGGTLTLSVTNLVCSGTGIKFWLFMDGTGGANNNDISGNDFCNTSGGVWNEGSSTEFGGYMICQSPISINSSFSVSVSPNNCYYVFTDGYSGSICEYDLAASCAGCELVENQSCWSDVTSPYIMGGIKADTANFVNDSTFIVELSEPIRCCEIDKTDFLIQQNGSAFSPICISSAKGLNCQWDYAGSFTNQIQITLCSKLPIGYDNKWLLQPFASSNIVDLCNKQIDATKTVTIPSNSNGACLSASISGSSTICSGQTATDIQFVFQGTPPFSLAYSINGNIQPTINGINAYMYNITNPSAGIYKIDTVSGGGCIITSFTDSAMVVINPTPSVSFTDVDSICINASSFALSGGSPSGGVYSGVGVTSNSFDPSIAGGGSHTLKYVYADGACSDSAYHSIVVLPCSDVWPGDANNDLVANYYDLLNIGVGFGSAGFARDSISNLWIAHNSIDWGALINSVDTKHSDCNGDGIINYNDTTAISINYGSTHLKTNNVNASTNSELYFISNKSSVAPGASLDFELWTGTSANPLAAIYGIASDINIGSNSLLETDSTKISFANNWLGNLSTEEILLQNYNKTTGDLKFGLTKITHSNSVGYGKIADIYLKTKASISALDSFELNILNSKIVDASGNDIAITNVPLKIYIDPALSVSEDLSNAFNLSIFPNPFSNETSISYSLKENSKVKIEAYNILGEKIAILIDAKQTVGSYKYSFSPKQLGFSNGIYLIKISINENNLLRKIIQTD